MKSKSPDEEVFFFGWRLTAARVVSLAAVIAITLYIYSIRSEVDRFQAYGYPGIFLLSILANATVILPAPGIALTFTFGSIFNPLWVALAAGAGASLGELTGYLAGFSGQGIVDDTRMYSRLERWTERFGGWAILVLAFIPNPFFDLAGASAGALGMSIPRFLFWAFLGKTLKMLLFAYAGAFSVDWLDLNFFNAP
ncbi:MAG: VTT domain-containing protein [Anaerolineales bacterium]|nr:VTT domain-containing protein [Anaerolineales bacterium]